MKNASSALHHSLHITCIRTCLRPCLRPCVIACIIAAVMTLAGCRAKSDAITAHPAGDTPRGADAAISTTTLFAPGDMGSLFWRIPAIVATNDGTLIVAADRRGDSNDDLPNIIDVVTRRSTDGGASWSQPAYAVRSDDGGGYGDAALGVHRPTGDVVMLLAHGPGVFLSTPEERTRIAVARSTDGGLTWSLPKDITDSLLHPIEGRAPIHALSGFVTSGAINCDDSGRLYAALVTWDGLRRWSPLAVYCIYSDDGGHSWTSSGIPADTAGDESKIVPLHDGRLMMTIRTRKTGTRRLCYSSDRGLSWSEPAPAPDLADPGCNGAALMLPDGHLLHSLALDPAKRRNVTLMSSADSGSSWHKALTLSPGRSAYSDLVLLPGAHAIGIVTEVATDTVTPDAQLPWSIVFTRIPLSSIPSSAPSAPSAQ